MTAVAAILNRLPNAELLWASPREVLNVVQVDTCGCHIVTASSDTIAKLPLLDTDLHRYSLETVKMFYNDARAAGFKIV
jgi:transaldolase